MKFFMIVNFGCAVLLSQAVVASEFRFRRRAPADRDLLIYQQVASPFSRTMRDDEIEDQARLYHQIRLANMDIDERMEERVREKKSEEGMAIGCCTVLICCCLMGSSPIRKLI